MATKGKTKDVNVCFHPSRRGDTHNIQVSCPVTRNILFLATGYNTKASAKKTWTSLMRRTGGTRWKEIQTPIKPKKSSR